MKSMLFSALAIFALATTGCAIQTGSGCSDSLCGTQNCSECMVLSGDCNCGAPRGLTPDCKLVRKLGDNRGMGLRVNERGSACNQGRGSGLFARMKSNPTAPAASMEDCGCGAGAAAGGEGGCGCGAGDEVVSISAGDCGCDAGDEVVSISGGDCGCDAGDTVVSVSDADCGCEEAGVAVDASDSVGGLLGKLGARGCKCKLGGCLLGRGGSAGAAIASGCGPQGCAAGGCGAGGCLGKLSAARQHPYGGTIPHTAQAPGNGTGMAPAYAYPYYTTRGPRDFLMKKPPSIGY